MALGDFAAARKAFETTSRDFVGSDESQKCKYKLAMLALIEGDEKGAQERFEKLAANPNGPLAAEATAMSKYLRGQLAAE